MKDKVHAHHVSPEHTPKTKEQQHAPYVPQESIPILVKAHATIVLQVPTQIKEMIHAQTVTTDTSQQKAQDHVLLVLQEPTLREDGQHADLVQKDTTHQALETESVPPVPMDLPQVKARMHAQNV
jgi:alpha-glucosidase (family GH31 glycosyl hydrolase)